MDYKIKVIYSIALLAIFIFLVSSVSADLKDILLGPSPQPTDVSVQVNSAPTVTSIIVDGDGSPLDYDGVQNVLLLAATTKSVNVKFDANDIDDNLNDATATAQFTRAGETNRPAVPQTCVCITGCATDTRTYECATPSANAIGMEWYDDDGSWTVTVGISDTLGSSASVGTTGTFSVDLLSDITFISGSPIGFGVVSPGGTDYASLDLEIRNDGNYDATPISDGGNGDVQVTAFDLCDETAPFDCTPSLPASNFDASDDSVNPCDIGDGTALADTITTDITDVNLPRGDGTGGNNIGFVSFCLETVPALQSDIYSAKASHPDNNQGGPWTIGLE
ncbi:hypothetical protein J4462_01850 [Candidatus Pacearchaeota archaeon]|nr:hypothetical protein [Candidatus Pacearchaeota archaeon]